MCVVLVACAPQVYVAMPESVEASYTLSGWPSNRIDIVTADARAPEQKNGDPGPTLRRLFQQSLSPPIVNPGERASLKLSLQELVARREGERWKADAKIEADVTDLWGKPLRKVTGLGTFSKADLLGTRTAAQCLEEAFRNAVLATLRELDQSPLP